MDVIVVEDEIVALERIRDMQLWKDDEYHLIGTSRNGVQALRLLESREADVLITDIEMPKMNGLELIEAVRERGYDLHVVILSCHESFDYARRAMRLGVDDYLIKDFLEEEALMAALKKAKSAKRVRKAAAAERRPSNIAEDPRAEELISMTIAGDPLLEDYLREHTADDESLFLSIFHIDCYLEQRCSTYESKEYLLQLLLENLGPGCAAGYLDKGDFLVLALQDSLSSVDQALLQQTIEASKETRGISLTVAWERSYELPVSLSDAFSRLKILLSYRPYLGNGRVIMPVHVGSVSYIDALSLEQQIQLLHRLGRQRRPASIIPVLRELYHQYLPGMLQFNYLQFLNSHVLTVLLRLIDLEGYDLYDLYERRYLPLRELNSLDTAEEMFQWFERKFRRLESRVEQESVPVVHNERVQRALDIILKGFRDSTLSLESIAETVGVHKGYLSRVFKEETGCSCYEYLQKYRIRLAERMLADQNLKVYEIAEQTGFHSYDQFCTVFKKHAGVSPSVFRKEQRKT